jgi:hypothetical protein
MKCMVLALLLSSLAAISVHATERAPQTTAIADFTIASNDPDRTLYDIVQFFRSRNWQVVSQRVIRGNLYELTVHSEALGLVLVLRLDPQGISSVGSYILGKDLESYEQVMRILKGYLESRGE